MSYSENNVENTNEDIHMEIHQNPRNLVDQIDINHIRVERNNIQIDPFLVDQVIPAGREDSSKENSPIPILVEQVIPAGRVESRVNSPILDDGDGNQPVAIDMTNAVESVLDRMVKKNESAIKLLTSTLTDHLTKLTGSIVELAQSNNSSRNTGKLPVDKNLDRNTGKLSVGPGHLPDGSQSARRMPARDEGLLNLVDGRSMDGR